MVRHIFVGIDLEDKNSVARIALDQEKSQQQAFINNRQGRARLLEQVKRQAEQAGGAKIVMAYEASSCGFVLRDEAEAMKIQCWVLAPTRMEKSVDQRKHKNDDRDADDVLEKLRGHVLAGNRLPTVWVPDRQTRDDRADSSPTGSERKANSGQSADSDAAKTARSGKAFRFRSRLDDSLSSLAGWAEGMNRLGLGSSSNAEQFAVSAEFHRDRDPTHREADEAVSR